MHLKKAGKKMEKGQEQHQRFLGSGQEKLRLQIALEELLGEYELSEDHRKDYETYLHRRIRPAMEYLIDAEDTIKMKRLEAYGWFGPSELDGFLKYAGERQKRQAFVWLLRRKDEKYGYEDRKFIL